MSNLENFGFRKDFSWIDRFNLKTTVVYEELEYEISTVDLGLNHQYDENLPPLYYETMIFIKGKTFEERYEKENPLEFYQERYTTQEEAEKRHNEIVELFKIGKVDELKIN